MQFCHENIDNTQILITLATTRKTNKMLKKSRLDRKLNASDVRPTLNL